MAALVIQHRERDVGDARKWIRVNTLKQGVKVAQHIPRPVSCRLKQCFCVAFKACLSQNSVVLVLEFEVQEDFVAMVLSSSFSTLLLSRAWFGKSFKCRLKSVVTCVNPVKVTVKMTTKVTVEEKQLHYGVFFFFFC